MAAFPSYYSHEMPTAKPDPAATRAAFGLLTAYRAEPPAQWSDNRLEQAQHYRGVIYVAVKAVVDLVTSSSFEVLKRKRKNRNRVTFGPGGKVSKSVSSAQAQGRDEDYEPYDDWDHPLCRLTHRPNENETFGELMGKVVLQNRLTGVAPLWTVPNRGGRPVELWSLKTALTYPIYSFSLQYPQGAWRVTPWRTGMWGGMLPNGLSVGTGALIPGEEVARFIDPHPLIDFEGYSPLTAGALQLDVLEAIDQSWKSAMDHGLQLDAVLIAPGLPDADCKALQAKMEQKHGGPQNASKFAVVAPPTDLKADLRPFGTPPKDMAFPEAWERGTKYVLSLFGVPASVAGLAAATSYSELYAARQQFHSNQETYLDRLGAWLTRVLGWPWSSFPDEYLIRAKPKPVNDHELREKQFTRQLSNDLLTYNEARRKDDLEPVEGGDVPVSLYVKQLEQKLMPQEPPAPPGGGGEGGGDPLAALLGGGSTPTGGAVPSPDNPAAEGSKPPAVGKSMSSLVGSAGGFLVPPAAGVRNRRKRGAARAYLTRSLEAVGGKGWPVKKAERREGEVWEGDSGRYFTLRGGHVVPAKAPGGSDAPAGDRPAAAQPGGGGKAGDGSAGPKAVEFGGGAEAVLNKVFPGVSHADLAAAANAMPGAEIRVTTTGGDGATAVRVEVRNPGGGFAVRSFYRTPDGSVMARNLTFENPPGSPVRGYEAFAAQVLALRKLGVTHVRTDATKDPAKKPPYVGHVVWPKFGYEGKLTDEQFRRLPAEVRKAMGEKKGILGVFGHIPGSRSVRKLYDEVPGGPEAWEKVGDTIYDMEFDLRDGSPSVEALKKYAERRKAKGG